jgi:hypothetical protein
MKRIMIFLRAKAVAAYALSKPRPSGLGNLPTLSTNSFALSSPSGTAY